MKRDLKRPKLKRIDLKRALMFEPGAFSITMSIGQWDGALQEFYDSGAILIELNQNEVPITAYKK